MMRASFAWRCLVFAASVCGWVILANSQEKKLWQVYAEAGETSFQQDRPSTAEVMLLSAVKEANSEGVQNPWLGKINYELGDLYSRAGDHSKAEGHFFAALHMWEQCHEPDTHEVAMCLNALGNCLDSQTKQNEAEQPYSRAIRIFKKLEKPSDVAIVVNNLASTYRAQAKYLEAEKCLEEGLAFVKHSKRKIDDKSVASLLEGLAMVHLAQNRFEEAEAVYKRLLAMGEAAKPYPKTLADDAHKQAGTLTEVKRYTQAERLLRGEIELRKQQPTSALIANAISDLANVHFRQRRYDEAETEKKQSIQIAKDTVQNPILDWAFADLALIQYGEGKGRQAELLFQESLHAMKQRRDQSENDKDRKALSFKIATRLERLAELYYDVGQNEPSASLYKEALDIREKDIGQNDFDTIATAKLYAEVLRKLKRNAEAREVEARFEQRPKQSSAH